MEQERNNAPKKKKLQLPEDILERVEEELEREFEEPMLPPKKAKKPKSLAIPTTSSSAYTMQPLPPPTPYSVTRENPLALKELPNSVAAVASAVEETAPYVYPLGERGDRQLMLFQNGVVLFSKSDTQKFVELDLNR